jgi:hypothetical protein
LWFLGAVVVGGLLIVGAATGAFEDDEADDQDDGPADEASAFEADYLAALDENGYGDYFVSETAAVAFLGSFCAGYAAFGEEAIADDLDLLTAGYCEGAAAPPEEVPAPEVTAVYPDLDGNPVVIAEGPTSFTDGTPDPIVVLDRVLETGDALACSLSTTSG